MDSINAGTDTAPAADSDIPPTAVPQRASLLGLPRELRDQIWTLAMSSTVAHDLKDEVVLDSGTDSFPLTLWHSSRQIRLEAMNLFFRNKAVKAYWLSSWDRWMRAFLPGIEVELTRLRVRIYWPVSTTRTGAMDWVKAFTARALSYGSPGETRIEAAAFVAGREDKMMRVADVEAMEEDEWKDDVQGRMLLLPSHAG